MTLHLRLVEPLMIPNSLQTQLRHMAIAASPYEICGLIYPHNIVVAYPNLCADKEHGFDFEAPLSNDIKAMWHSHPRGPSAPSGDDMPCMQLLVEHGFTFHHIIVTTKQVLEYEATLVDPETMGVA